jgi:hypothetical protein
MLARNVSEICLILCFASPDGPALLLRAPASMLANSRHLLRKRNRFHAYTAAVVLLQSVAQMRAHGLPRAAWTSDLECAKICLETLEFCGEVDDVAAQLYSIMAPIYLDLDDGGYDDVQHHHPDAPDATTPPGPDPTAGGPVPPPSQAAWPASTSTFTTPLDDGQDQSYLFYVPRSSLSPPSPSPSSSSSSRSPARGLVGLAEMLFEMLSRPFRDEEAREFGDVSSVGALWRY